MHDMLDLANVVLDLNSTVDFLFAVHPTCRLAIAFVVHNGSWRGLR